MHEVSFLGLFLGALRAVQAAADETWRYSLRSQDFPWTQVRAEIWPREHEISSRVKLRGDLDDELHSCSTYVTPCANMHSMQTVHSVLHES